MKEYTIDRSKWVCGGKRFSEKLGLPKMLNEEGRMCCLGQICKAEGVSESELRSTGSPWTLNYDYGSKDIPDWMFNNRMRIQHSTIANKMMRVNDDFFLNQKKREKRLKELALKVDIKLKFTGKLGVK